MAMCMHMHEAVKFLDKSNPVGLHCNYMSVLISPTMMQLRPSWAVLTPNPTKGNSLLSVPRHWQYIHQLPEFKTNNSENPLTCHDVRVALNVCYSSLTHTKPLSDATHTQKLLEVSDGDLECRHLMLLAASPQSPFSDDSGLLSNLVCDLRKVSLRLHQAVASIISCCAE